MMPPLRVAVVLPHIHRTCSESCAGVHYSTGGRGRPYSPAVLEHMHDAVKCRCTCGGNPTYWYLSTMHDRPTSLPAPSGMIWMALLLSVITNSSVTRRLDMVRACS